MTGDLVISSVPPAAVPALWPKVEPLLAPATKQSRAGYVPCDILAGALTETLALWVVLDGEEPVAAFTTRVEVLPRQRLLCMDWVGGARMKEWLADALDLLRGYAREHNCDAMQGYGRKGWQRALEKFGWEPDYMTYRVDLDDGQGQ